MVQVHKVPRRGSSTMSTDVPPQDMQLLFAGNANARQCRQREARKTGCVAGQEKRRSSIARSFIFACSCIGDGISQK
jgi:hypothetical protein